MAERIIICSNDIEILNYNKEDIDNFLMLVKEDVGKISESQISLLPKV